MVRVWMSASQWVVMAAHIASSHVSEVRDVMLAYFVNSATRLDMVKF
jgi:hypothetical protein